jgi:cell pole-organizing protein PopZ
MTQAAKTQEPSMEEILASIRRIIADDDASKSVQRAPEPPRPEPVVAPPPPPPPMPPRAFEPEPRPLPEPPRSMASDAIAEQSSDILDLTESMTSAPPPPPPAPPPMPEPIPAPSIFRTIDGTSDVSFDEVVEKPAPAPTMQSDIAGRLLSNQTSAAVDSAFSALAQTVLVQNARTLEDLVREMLRPMLKTWLDDNLPGLVERLVRAEIERVSRGRAS